jgi:signal transduction histidine kinase
VTTETSSRSGDGGATSPDALLTGARLPSLTVAPERSVVRAAVLRYVTWSVLVVMVLGVGTLVIGHNLARDGAERDARLRGASIAQTIAAPLVDSQVRAGNPAALRRLGLVLRNRMSDGSIRHMKLWSRDGTLIWSDESALVGNRYPLAADVRELFGTRRVTAELSNLDQPENVGERGEGQLLEVYAGVRDADDRPLVFEAYLTTEQMDQEERAIITAFLPLTVGALLLLLGATVPLGLSLARRVQRAQLERSKLMRHAIDASDLERRRIAQDLHDGVIQDLAGLGYALPSVAAALADGAHPDAQEAVSRATSLVQQDVAALRALMTDIYPPDLEGAGFLVALDELARRSMDEGALEVEVHVSPDLRLSLDAARLAYRVVREGLRNVVKHAGADRVDVYVHQGGGLVTVRVQDDGRGLAGEDGAPRQPLEGHLGLRLLADTVRDFAGALDLGRGPERGTLLEVTYPSVLVPA